MALGPHASRLNNELATWALPVVHRPHVASGGKALGWEMWIGSTIIGLILLALAVAGAWSWYESHLKSQSKDQMVETAERDVRETAECHLEAFMSRPGSTETDLEVQAAFMDIVWRHEDTCFFQTAPRQRPMTVAHLTLVTSSIRFAGGRIEVGLARRRQTLRFAPCGSR